MLIKMEQNNSKAKTQTMKLSKRIFALLQN